MRKSRQPLWGSILGVVASLVGFIGAMILVETNVDTFTIGAGVFFMVCFGLLLAYYAAQALAAVLYD